MNKFVKYIGRFFDSPQEAEKAVERLIAENPSIGKGEIFRQVSAGNGKPTTHVSRYQDDMYDWKIKRS